MKFLAKIWDNITFVFVGMSILIDEDRNFNEDGYWDKYWERKARKYQRQETKKNRK